MMNQLTDEQVLARLAAAAKLCGAAGKPGMSGENVRAEWAKEAMKRGLIGYKLKKKYRG